MYQRALVVLDMENIYLSNKKQSGKRLDLEKLDEWIHRNYLVVDKVAFLDSKRSNGFKDWLYTLGWTIHDVTTRENGQGTNTQILVKNAIDIELALEVFDTIIEVDISTLLIISGDGDYLPLVKRLKKRDITIHVLGVDGCLSKKLQKFADSVFSLEMIGHDS